ncbi:MAG: outer membrane beta-barrel protein [Candidatus Firestonebacteria bacterium]
MKKFLHCIIFILFFSTTIYAIDGTGKFLLSLGGGVSLPSTPVKFKDSYQQGMALELQLGSGLSPNFNLSLLANYLQHTNKSSTDQYLRFIPVTLQFTCNTMPANKLINPYFGAGFGISLNEQKTTAGSSNWFAFSWNIAAGIELIAQEPENDAPGVSLDLGFKVFSLEPRITTDGTYFLIPIRGVLNFYF